jgi:hypothetical protein
MKHVGKMKNNGARIVIAYRTIPGDANSALVIGTNALGDAYHDALMSVVESDLAQQANEVSEILAVKKFPDGNNMLAHLHTNGHLKKVPTDGVIVTPTRNDEIPLDELNKLIAQQKGVSVGDLATTEDGKPATKTELKAEKEISTTEMTPAEMRSRADALYKEAAKLRKTADELDPPKKKAKTETVEA